MLSEKRWIGIVVAFLALSLLLVIGCSEKKVQEKMTERALKQATGEDVDVKVQGGKVTLEQKGSKTEMEETGTWPSEMFADVPEFTAGKIEHVIKSHEEGDIRKFNVFFVDISGDDVQDYAKALEGKGWQTNLIQMGDKGGMLSGEKGNEGMTFAYSLEEHRGTLSVYNTQ